MNWPSISSQGTMLCHQRYIPILVSVVWPSRAQRIRMVSAVDPDQDLLDRLDRKEGLSPSMGIVLSAGVAALGSAVAYLTLIMEIHANREVAADVAILLFIGSAVALATGYFKLR
jgi:hypothetical protein